MFFMFVFWLLVCEKPGRFRARTHAHSRQGKMKRRRARHSAPGLGLRLLFPDGLLDELVQLLRRGRL
jgi:hypothetical protein